MDPDIVRKLYTTLAFKIKGTQQSSCIDFRVTVGRCLKEGGKPDNVTSKTCT